jgi:hypothetical protein
VVGGVLHPPGVARGAEVRLAGGGDKALETAVGTANSGETPGQDPAVEVGAEVALDEGGEPAACGAPLPGCGEEGLEPVADDQVEEGLLGLPPAELAEWSAGRAGVVLPGLDRAGGVLHAGPQGKPRAGTAPRVR